MIRGKNGSVFEVSKSVGDFRVSIGGKVIAEAEANVIFKSTMDRLSALIEYAEKLELEGGKNFLVTSTMTQLAIVTMASALEIYGKKRLLEIEAANGITDWNAVLHKTGIQLEDLTSRAKANSRTRLEELNEEKRLNLDNLDEFGRIFEKGAGIRISDIDRKEIYKILSLRQKIIHGGLRSDELYMENGEPVFAKSEKAREFMRELVSFVETVHARSES